MDKAKQVFFAITDWCGNHKKVTLIVGCIVLGFVLAKLL